MTAVYFLMQVYDDIRAALQAGAAKQQGKVDEAKAAAEEAEGSEVCWGRWARQRTYAERSEKPCGDERGGESASGQAWSGTGGCRATEAAGAVSFLGEGSTALHALTAPVSQASGGFCTVALHSVQGSNSKLQTSCGPPSRFLVSSNQ